MRDTGQPGSAPDFERFARIVKARRDALGLNQEQVSANGGPSSTTFTNIENLRWRPGRAQTLQRLDIGLRWEPGSAARVLYEGGDPTPQETAAPPLRETPSPPVASTTERSTAHLAISLTVLLDTATSGMWSSLGDRLPSLPTGVGRALRELDAAAYLAERLALQLAESGDEYAGRRREARSKIREWLDTPMPQAADTTSGDTADPFDWLLAPSQTDWAIADDDENDEGDESP